jgi:hypothetical protein
VLRKILTIVALCLIALSSVGCGGSSGSKSLLKMAPADSFAVLSVNWKTVSRDEDLKRMVKGADAERIFAQLNIASDAVNDLAVFSEAGNSPDATQGMILRGSFKNEEVVAGLKTRGWQEQSYQERKIFSNPADGTCLIALTRNVLVLGTRSGVEGAAKAAHNSAASFAANSTYQKLSSHLDDEKFPVVMMLAFPQTAQDAASTALDISSAVMDLAGVGPLGELLNKIGYARGLGCVISRKGDAFPMQLTAIMKDEEAATFVSGALNLMKGLTKMVPQRNLSPTDQEAFQSLQSLSINRVREIVSLKMTMTRKDLLRGT